MRIIKAGNKGLDSKFIRILCCLLTVILTAQTFLTDFRPVRVKAVSGIIRTGTISQLNKMNGESGELEVGERGEFFDNFSGALGDLAYLREEYSDSEKAQIIKSSNGIPNTGLEAHDYRYDGDGNCLRFGYVPGKENKRQSAYFAIDASNYTDVTFGIRFRQKSAGSFKLLDGNPTGTSKVSAVIEYSVDGGISYKTIKVLNNRGGTGQSPSSGSSYLPYYNSQGDNYANYNFVPDDGFQNKAQMLNQKPADQRLSIETDYDIYLEGADNNPDVRVRIQNLIYENTAGAEGAHAADLASIAGSNYIAFDNLRITGEYHPMAEQNPAGIEITPKAVTLLQNETAGLSGNVLPVNISAANKAVTWSTSDADVAIVDSNGLVTAVNAGTAYITVRCTNFPELAASCLVTVARESESTRLIKSFIISEPRAVGVIDQVEKTIRVQVPAGTDLTNLTAEFFLSSPATAKAIVEDVIQKSGITVNDFSEPVVYKIRNISNETAEYTVTVTHQEDVSGLPSNYYVSNPEEIHGLTEQLKPGDTIIMRDGIWNNCDIRLSADGSESRPITLKAQTVHGVKLTGASRITLSGSYLVLDGVDFEGRSATKLDGAVVMEMFSYHCRMTNVTIDDYNPTREAAAKHVWIWNYGTYNRVDHSSFRRKEYEGEMMRLYKGIEHNARIDHNYFGERTSNPQFSNNLECIQVGMYTGAVSAWETADSNSVIEDNYFYGWNGEIEIISVKSNGVTIRNNTIEDSAGTICLRIAENCDVYGNYFLQHQSEDSGGIRIYGGNHKIYNNYIEGVSGQGQQRSGIVLQAGADYRIPNSATDVKVAHDIIIANNTLVDCSVGTTFGAEPSASKTASPENIVFVNNVIIGSPAKKTIMNRKTPIGASVIRNNYADPIGDSNLPLYGSYTSSDGEQELPESFQFIRGNTEFVRIGSLLVPTSQSAVIGAGIPECVDLSFLLTDIRGFVREGEYDAGAYQLHAVGEAANHPLTIDDVGPVDRH